MNTDRLMQLALEMAGLGEIPGDSAIHHPGGEISKVLFGIDLKAPELVIASAQGFDCAISHHPVGGSSTLRFHEVLERHVDQMVGAGVPRDVAEETMCATIEDRRVLSSMTNYDHDPSVAVLLDIPYLNIHTPLDEIGRRRMAEAAAVSEANDLAAYCCIQQRHTYLRPKCGADFGLQTAADRGLLDYCKARNITPLAYSPLLGGAYTRDDKPLGSQYVGPDCDARMAALAEVAGEKGATVNQVVFAWMMHGDPAVLPVFSASTPEQMREDLGALGVQLTEDDMTKLNEAGA